MNIGLRINNPSEGRIFFPDNRPPLKCTVEKGVVTIKDKCEGCGSNEVKNYKCKYCGREL